MLDLKTTLGDILDHAVCGKCPLRTPCDLYEEAHAANNTNYKTICDYLEEQTNEH